MKVFSNLAISLDGKIASKDRGFVLLGTGKDHARMQVLRKRADAIIMGASTLRTFKQPLAVRGARRQPLNVILSSDLTGVSPAWPFFTRAGFRRVIFVTGTVPRTRLARFERTSTVVPIDPRRSSAKQIITALSKIGVRRLLVEGGGGLMWQFARHDLIDEYNVTLTPWIVGGASAPTLVDGEGFGRRELLKLRLVSCRRVGQELYLVYRRK